MQKTYITHTPQVVEGWVKATKWIIRPNIKKKKEHSYELISVA